MATEIATTVDAIEREILINASLDRVWNLVSKTGFWVGEQIHFEHEGKEGETIVVDSKKWGLFPVFVERLQPQTRAVYRWSSCFPGEQPTAGKGTRVEFNLEERADGVLVSVRESGFSLIDATEDFRVEQVRGNTDGWEMQLAALKRISEEHTA